MMGLAELGLGVIPPIFAILVEALNPVSKAVIRSSAQRDFGNIGRSFGELANLRMAHVVTTQSGEDSTKVKTSEIDASESEAQLVETAAKFGEGAVEAAGAALTVVSVTSSGFAVLHEIPHPFWPALGYVLFFMALALWLLYILGGRSFFEISNNLIGPRIWGKKRITRARLAAFSVYFGNGALIAASIAVFFIVREPPSHNGDTKRVSQPSQTAPGHSEPDSGKGSIGR